MLRVWEVGGHEEEQKKLAHLHIRSKGGTIGMVFNHLPHRSPRFLDVLLAGASTSEHTFNILEQWHVTQTPQESIVAACDFSHLRHKEIKLQPCEPRHSTLLKYHRPYKSSQLAAHQAWKRTSTNNVSSINDSKVLMAHQKIQRSETRQPRQGF